MSGAAPIFAVPVGGIALVLGVGDLVSPTSPFGWLGSILVAVLGAYTLHRAGSVKAWKETAEARAERLEDVERQLGELRAELAIPERIEGIISLMASTAERQNEAAEARLASALDRLEDGAENRTGRILQAIERTIERKLDEGLT